MTSFIIYNRYLYPDVQIIVFHLEIFSGHNFRTFGNCPEISDMPFVSVLWSLAAPLSETDCFFVIQKRCSYFFPENHRQKYERHGQH